MSLPVRSAPEASQFRRSSLFAGDHVHLDELRWSPAFEAQVSTWASSATLLLVLESGDAMLNVQVDAPLSRNEEPSMSFVAARPRPMERCAVFRFDDVAASASARLVPLSARRPEWPLVRLSPRALLRFYWRRHALLLGYPSPAEHVEEDAVALLRHVTSRILVEAQEESACISEGRLRHRALAREAKALMAVSISDPHPIAQVARALHTSPFHLAHVFRTEVGSSPHKYLVQLRIISALVQLRAGARDLSKLALELGFCHHSHFTAVFRTAVGYTPREVRRMLTAECIADLGIAARCS